MDVKSSCAVIGEGNLLLRCLEKLKTEGFEIVHVFTNTDRVSTFCNESTISTSPSDSDLTKLLRDKVIGFLFSIANPIHLPKEVLELPLHYAIQYHDSPLPVYSGTHATSWAIMNEETTHGICWNILDGGIDTGDILQEKAVEIEAEDTAFTLNIKCQEAAYEAFSYLLKDIQMETITRRQQSSVNGSFYGPDSIPPNGGILNFDWPNRRLRSLIKSLDFGRHENRLCIPKLRSESGNFFLVTKLLSEKLEIHSEESKVPGTILKVEKNILDIKTREGEVRVALAKIDGSELSREDLFRDDLRIDRILGIDSNIDTSSLGGLRRNESFWIEQLVLNKPVLFPRQRMSAVLKKDTNFQQNTERKKCVIHLPSNIKFGEDFLMAALICFFSRVCDSSKLSIGIIADKSCLQTKIKNLFAGICPLNVDLEENDEIRRAIEKCKAKISLLKQSGTFQLDVFYRYPVLKDRKQVPLHNIVLGKEPMDADCSIENLLTESIFLMLLENESNIINVHYNSTVGQNLSYVETIMAHFPNFIQSMLDDEKTPLNRIALLSKGECDKLYQNGEHDTTLQTSLFLCIEKVANKYKSRTALKTSSHSMTYEALIGDVNALSGVLYNCIDSDSKSIIGIHLPNSMQYVVSVLSIMNLDHVFLPLPVDYPRERIQFTIEEADVSCIIANKEEVESLPCRSDDWRKVTSTKIANETVVVYKRIKFSSSDFIKGPQTHEKYVAKDTIYVMYTSGSTGRPKGVAIRDVGVRNVAMAQASLWDLNENDVVGQFASIGFDATISEMFTSLVSGATLAIIMDNEKMGNEFINAVKRLDINTITLTPSLLNIYDPKDMPSLQKVITAGEACTLDVALKWTSTSNIRFFNAYGPTETTVCATNYEFTSSDFQDIANCDLPIGKAIQGVHVYLFDKYQQPVPSDVMGEIYIGGIGVSNGYIGHARVFNDKKFVQNPMLSAPMILYKTGDHGIRDKDGNITYLGRMDDLVNIRGQRVDLSEVETILSQHPSVDMAAVVLHKGSNSSEISIAAFVAPSSIEIASLKSYLLTVLPRYMIPTHIIKREIFNFPLTTNGKIDRKKLEKDESIYSVLSEYEDSKRNLDDLGMEIAKLWCNILHIDKNLIKTFQLETSFSELGGNSLHLVLLQRSFEESIGINLSFAEIGSSDTIEEFANVVRKKQKGEELERAWTRDDDTIRKTILEDTRICEEEIREHARKSCSQLRKSNNDAPKKIIISGVTGFLGAHLLSEILLQTSAHAFCMVRSTTEHEGLERIKHNMLHYGIWSPDYSRRITIVLSDLAKQKLGIEPTLYNYLTKEIDTVFMNAAKIDFNKGYEEHRIENVQGTKNLILFALDGKQKYIFATSTLGVFLFPSTDSRSPLLYYETDIIDDPIQVAGGYGRSKWASERLVKLALKYLPGGAIFRPGRITGSTQNGKCPEKDFFTSVLMGINKLGYYPNFSFPFDLTPVDYVAKGMVEISIQNFTSSSAGKPSQVFHLYNKDTIMFRDLFKGMDLQPCQLDAWRKYLKDVSTENQELLHFMPFFLSSSMEKLHKWPIFDTSNTDDAVSETTRKLLRPSEDLLMFYKQVLGIFKVEMPMSCK